MSKINHLKRIVQILRDNFENEIIDHVDWTYNLKNWTINFMTEEDGESVTAYRVTNDVTNWSDYITLELRVKEWKELV
jgi:hypothetical protein